MKDTIALNTKIQIVSNLEEDHRLFLTVMNASGGPYAMAVDELNLFNEKSFRLLGQNFC